jgi:hypothetical protein
VKCAASQIPLKQPAQSVFALKLKLEEALHSQDKTTFEIITKKKKTLELDSAVISMSQNGSRSYIATKVWNIYMYST